MWHLSHCFWKSKFKFSILTNRYMHTCPRCGHCGVCFSWNLGSHQHHLPLCESYHCQCWRSNGHVLWYEAAGVHARKWPESSRYNPDLILSRCVLKGFMNVIISLTTESVCIADQTSTTTAPPTLPTTTTAPPAPPTPTPPGTPERGTYTVNSINGTVCLLAHMGLQLNFSYFSQAQNKVNQSCTCICV